MPVVIFHRFLVAYLNSVDLTRKPPKPFTVVSESIPLATTLRVEYQDIIIDSYSSLFTSLCSKRLRPEARIRWFVERPVPLKPQSSLDFLRCCCDNFRCQKIESTELVDRAKRPHALPGGPAGSRGSAEKGGCRSNVLDDSIL